MNTSPSHATTHAAAAPHARILKILKSGKSGFRLFTLALALLFAQTANAATYYVTGNGSSASASKVSAGGTAIANGSNKPIQDVINAIRVDANGTATTIRFSSVDYPDMLIGSDYIEFSSTGSPAWGTVTLTGDIASSNNANTILLSGTMSISSKGSITNSSGSAVYNNGTGTVNISEGEVTGYGTKAAVYNASTGAVIISGSAIIGGGLGNYGNGIAIDNAGAGKITVQGGKINAKDLLSTSGVIVIRNSGTATANRLEISGTAEITASTGGNAVYNASTGGILLSGNPTITGTIMKASTGILSVNSGFTATTKTYTLGFTNAQGLAVAGGASKIARFTLTSTITNANEGVDLSLVVSDSDIAFTGGYAVAKSETTYTITKGTGTFLSIQNAIDNIRTQANGAASTIQFGNGTAVLDIGTGYVTFDGTASPVWGTIALAGKITSANTSNGTIYLSNGASISNTADIANTATSNGTAVRNASTGAVGISGGTVSATTGVAVQNSSTGKITVSGTAKITSANVTAASGTILIVNSGTATDERLVITGGTVENTANNANARAIYNASTGAVGIKSDGSVTATAGTAVYNASTGAVNISNYSSVSATTGTAINNASTGAVTISNNGYVEATSGTAINNASTGTVTINNSVNVYATTGVAINNAGTGKITVSGTANALVYSENTSATSGAIVLASSGTATAARLEITGGTVQNQAGGNAIYNASTGAVGISGGIVKATTGYALSNAGTGTAAITGGLVFAYGAALTGVINGSYSTPSGNAAIVAWNKPASGTPAYTALTSTDIAANPGTTAMWKFNTSSEYSRGIAYTNGANTGHLVIISGFTLSKITQPTPTGLTATYGQTLANVALPAVSGGAWAWESATTTDVGNAGTQTHKAKFTTTDANNYNNLTGIDVGIEVAKIAGTFGTPAAVSETYATTLTLANVTLPAGYAWTTPTTALDVSKSGTAFAATYTDPSGNYNAATGNITVNVAKAAGTFGTPAAVSETYSPTLTLANLTLPANYVWNAPTTTLDVSKSGQTFPATYTDPSGNYNAATGNITVNVAKANHNMAGISFPDAALTYNGAAHSIEISGTLPAGVTVTYDGNGKTAAGTYTVTATFTVTDAANYNVPEPQTATLVINNKITYDMSGIAFTGKTVTYNGVAHSLAISGTLPTGVTAVAYEGNDKTAAGTYTVTATFTVANTATHNIPAAMTAVLTIDKANHDMTGVSFPDAAFTHNGEPHSIEISGTLPTGVTVTYEGNGKTAEGEYEVTATFAVTDAANYNTPAPITATLTINNKATYDMTGIAFADKTVTHNGEPQSIQITGTLPTGVTVTYDGNGQTEAGKHTITATFAVANPATHNIPAPMTAVLTIEEEATPIFTNRTTPQIGSIVVKSANGAILLSNLPMNAKVEIYTLQGKRIYFAYPGNPSILKIGVQTKGVYVVKAGSQTARVVVK